MFFIFIIPSLFHPFLVSPPTHEGGRGSRVQGEERAGIERGGGGKEWVWSEYRLGKCGDGRREIGKDMKHN